MKRATTGHQQPAAPSRPPTGTATPPREGEGAGGALTLVLDMPDHALTLNRSMGKNDPRTIRLKNAHKDAALLVGLATVPKERQPWFPAGVDVVAWCAVERRKGGQRWDLGGLVEALKPAFDSLNGIVYADDRQIAGVIVEWDSKPTGAGIVTVTFAPSPK